MALTEGQKALLLELAHTTINSYVRNDHLEEIDIPEPGLQIMAGAFVTIRINRALRGCTGYMREDKPLYRVVRDMAISAAASDPRFSPVREDELANLDIGISVLSPLTKVDNFEEIEIGIHGLLIDQNGRRGVLLPQVPAERGWDRETFLTNLCYKAGLPGDAWKRGASIYSFTAEVF